MAQEEIKLVGSFKDDITPQLKKLNKQIDAIGRSFSKFGRNLRPMAKEFGRMSMASNSFNETLKSQRSLLQANARAMRDYKSQAGKMASSMRHIQGEHSKMMRAQGMSRAEQKRAARGGGKGGGRLPGMPAPAAPVLPARMPKAPKAPRAPMAAPAPPPAAIPTPAAPKVSRGKSKQAGSAVGTSAGQSFMKSVASTAIGMGIANAFMSGVQGIKNMFMAPFQKFGAAFSERIGDEMDDLKSAGGLYALDLDLTADNGNQKLFKDFNNALQYQERLNADMAASASNLPGTTSDFVKTQRQLTDTIQMTMEKNREAFIKFGESEGADVSMGGIDAAKEAMATVGQNLTETVMLASAGQQGGLPMHIAIQQMLGTEKGKFKAMTFTNKFRAAFQKNPLLKNFLMRAESEINKYEAGSVEKLAAIMDVFQRATPEEQISKMRGSLAGLMESVRSGLLDPQGGLFGLSRAVQQFDKEGNVVGPLLKKNADIYGNTLYRISEDLMDGNEPLTLGGEAVKKGAQLTAEQLKNLNLSFDETTGIVKQGTKQVGDFATSTTYLFEQIRNIGANYGAIFTQIVGLLPTIFDPFARMTEELIPIAERSQEMFRVFRVANKALDEDVVKMRSAADNATKGLGSKLSKQVLQRSSLFSMTDFLQGIGVMGDEEAKSIKKQLVGEASRTSEAINGFDQTASTIFKQIFERLLNSPVVENLAQVAGTVFGGIIRTVFDIIDGGIRSLVDKGPMETIFKGFIKGFDTQFADMGGFDVFMKKVNEIVARVMSEIGKFITGTVMPFLFKQLINLILGGFKAGPVGMLISGALLTGLVKAIVGLTTSAFTAAKSLQAAALSAKQFAGGFTQGAMGMGSGRGGSALSRLGRRKGGMVGKLNTKLAQGLGVGNAKGLMGMGSRAALKFAKPMAELGSDLAGLSKEGLRLSTKQISKLGGNIGKKMATSPLGKAIGGGVKMGGKVANNIGQGLIKAAGGGGKFVSNIGGALKSGLGAGLKMGAIGGVLKAGLGLMEGKSPLDAISEGLASAGGSAIGAAIGTIILPGVGTAIGGFIGGFLGENEEFVNGVKNMVGLAIPFVEDAFDAINGAMEPLVGIFSELWNATQGVVGAIIEMVPGLEGTSEGFNLLKGVIMVLMLPFKMLQIGLIGLYETILRVKKQFGFGSDEDDKKLGELRQKREQTEASIRIDAVQVGDASKTDQFLRDENVKKAADLRAEMETAGAKRKAEINKELYTIDQENVVLEKRLARTKKRQLEKEESKKTDPTKPAAAQEAEKALANVAVAAREAGSTFENNKKVMFDGKEWGWAEKNGKKVLVEWGSAATETIKQVGDVSSAAIKELEEKAKTELPEIDTTWEGWDSIKPPEPAPEPAAPAPKRSDFGGGRSGAAAFNKAMREFEAKEAAKTKEQQQPAQQAQQDAKEAVPTTTILNIESPEPPVFEVPQVELPDASVTSDVKAKDLWESVGPAVETVTPEGEATKLYEFGSVIDGLKEIAFSLDMIYECLKAPEVTPIEPAPEATAGENTTGELAGTAVGGAIGTAIAPGLGTVIGGALGNFVGNLFGGSEKPVPVSPVAPVAPVASTAPVAPTVPVAPVAPTPAVDGTNLLKKVFDNTVLGAGLNLLSNVLGGGGEGETTVPVAPTAPAAPTAEVVSVPEITIPTPEETGVSQVIENTQTVVEPIVQTDVNLLELKQPIMELPMQMTDALALQTMELGTIIGTYLMETNAMLQTVADALAQSKEDTVKIHQSQLPLAVKGNFGTAEAAASEGFFPMYKGNVFTASSGMNLGSAISEEMKNKPSGSDLVIANSAETIIPPGMGVGSSGGGTATIQIGDINVMVSGVDDPKEIANTVAEEILGAIRQASYQELFTN